MGVLYSQNTTSDKPYSLVGVVRDIVSLAILSRMQRWEVTSKDTSCRTIGYTDKQG
ncbi:MAG: hypothetical protein Q4A56_06190 [Porphyromonadaceae bacterium]|nr:hypothetical protein [Porphyromonadaceae bacterium]